MMDLQQKIYTIRDVQVMLDEDLAQLYRVESKRLNEQVKRNIDRFPSDFIFEASEDEIDFIVSHFVMPSTQFNKCKTKPYLQKGYLYV